jgi:NTP pyrophosphatase (non-canonical NTP hydrolase)
MATIFLLRNVMKSAIADLMSERARQDSLWGQQDHEAIVWLGILTEEVGELAQQIIESTIFNHRQVEEYNFESMREEAVQVAAVALALVECLDRNKDKYTK